MVYSVYNAATGKYDYYERSSRPEDALYPEPKHLSGKGALGMSSESAGYRLPAGCRHVGSGDSPKGMVATRNSPIGLGGFDLGTPKLFLLLVGGFAVYRFLERK